MTSRVSIVNGGHAVHMESDNSLTAVMELAMQLWDATRLTELPHESGETDAMARR